MNEEKATTTVVVIGDVTIDSNIARVRRAGGTAQAWNADDLTAAFCQHGGAALLADLINAVAKNLRQTSQVEVEVRQINLPPGRVNPADRRFHHSYAMWAPFKLDERASDSERKVWRVQEFLGLNSAYGDVGLSDKWRKLGNDPLTPDLVIVDDANLGFRGHPELWPRALLSDTAKPWILVKMAQPVAQGRLWEHLHRNHADRLVMMMTANDLRSTQVQISRGVSWERTAQDVVWELSYNPRVNTLTQCAHVIISFGTAGAILLSRDRKTTSDAVLFFDPNVLEGEWGRDHKGFMIGYTSCLTAGIARELMLKGSQPNIARGIQSGIRAMRFLHVEGYGEAAPDAEQVSLAFPAAKLAAKLAESGKCLATATVRNPARVPVETAAAVPVGTSRLWTILEDKYPESLEGVAAQIVREGLESALPEVPIGSFGKLKTVDRNEIEGLRSISGLIREYCERYQQAPLSIAVFGPPGSGKSFAVREVASSVRPGEIEVLNFNLSQFGGPEDLFDAFHQVRDKALSGRIPLVFWDEFDTPLQQEPLGWLRYFLAPMHDGEFQEGQITHPIGRSIFVFAGGTSHSLEAFGANLDEKERRAAKLPDFVSRLKGFLNVLGPNRQEESTRRETKDPYYIIRRAIILRSVFERFTPQLLRDEGNKRIVSIDQGVLHAFLLTQEYRHGARSMEATVAMSQLAGKANFERSCLPSEAQLSLHIDGRDFSALMHRMEVDDELLEKLAEAAHEVFCDHLRAEGYKGYAPETRGDKGVHSSLRPYAELPEDEKEQNRSNVRDIPNKLASVGYVMLPARGNETSAEFEGDEIEKLAEMEHERWMQEKLDSGWQYAERTAKARKLHQSLVPWHELPEDDKDKDRALVGGIPRIVAKAGYIMVKSV